MLPRDDADLDDVPKKAESHAADMTRYRITARERRLTRRKIRR
jgi:hypothetical protein